MHVVCLHAVLVYYMSFVKDYMKPIPVLFDYY